MKKPRSPPHHSQGKDFETLHSQALAEAQQGHAQAAFELFSRAVAIDPRNWAAISNCGNALMDLQRFDEALARFDQALAIKPDFADALNNRGNALQALRRYEDAVASYERALAVKPGYIPALKNRGNALLALNRTEEALASYVQALAIRPDNAQALTHVGNLLQGLGRQEEALGNYERALAIRPDHVEAWNNRANVLLDLKRFDEALASYARALSHGPDYPHLPGNWVHTKMKVCDWTGLSAAFDQLAVATAAGKPVISPFASLGTPLSSSLQRKCAELLIEAKFPTVSTSGSTAATARHDRIRLGYFSADFCEHPVAHLAAELFERHDRTRFEVIAYSFGPPVRDPMRLRLEAAFDQFIDVHSKTDQEIAQMTREQGLDIAVDLMGFTRNARTGVFAARAAPVQVNFLGYPGTVGADYIDYLIADPTLIPEEQRGCYTEKIAYLPHTYQVNDTQRTIADRTFTRQEAGLPEEGFVFCCFNNNWKITPEVFDIWMRLLQQVAGSVLWLFEDNPTAGRNLRMEAARRGIPAERLVFAPRMNQPEHLARHRLADLFLDTHPYNAHTTCSDALWAGLPVLTRIGETFASRVAASLLRAVGLPELVTESAAAYEALSLELATDPPRLAALRRQLAVNRPTAPLFDTELFTRHIEAAYTLMWQRHLTGLPPEQLVVSP
jgi:predicted O-linked N-acetylglucosamine transferase (SPINDLY family)